MVEGFLESRETDIFKALSIDKAESLMRLGVVVVGALLPSLVSPPRIPRHRQGDSFVSKLDESHCPAPMKKKSYLPDQSSLLIIACRTCSVLCSRSGCFAIVADFLPCSWNCAVLFASNSAAHF
jgi:hypothetical protein